MFVLGAPEELEALVGLFGKLYVSTFDCATFYCQRIQHQEVGNIFANDTPPSGMELEKPSSYIYIYIYYIYE